MKREQNDKDLAQLAAASTLFNVSNGYYMAAESQAAPPPVTPTTSDPVAGPILQKIADGYRADDKQDLEKCGDQCREEALKILQAVVAPPQAPPAG